VPENAYDRLIKGTLPLTPHLSGQEFDPSTLPPEVRRMYKERNPAVQVAKPEPVLPPRKKTAWPTSTKVAWINRCVSSLVSQGVSDQHARTYATCIANAPEKEFGMEEYDQMMKASPNPKGSEYDRRLDKVFKSCGNILHP
jgi:hypothetical protein